MKSLNIKTEVSTKKLLQLERCGRYDEALLELADIWDDKSVFPNVEGLNKRDAAELYLRCGTLYGFVGHNEQIPDSQERSKNLLTEAFERFLDIYDVEKIAECENYLALAYWRSGGYEEAETWIDSALSRKLPHSSFVRLYCVITKSGNLLSKRKYDELIKLFEKEEKNILEFGDDCLRGDFYNHYGLALKNLDKIPDSLKAFELAKKFHTLSGHQVYLGGVENNIAQTYKLLKNFTEAHEAIDNSANIFKSINADERYGFALDTKALIYVDEGKLEEAFETIETAVEILERGENKGFLVETLATKISILIKLNKLVEASLCLSKAVDEANTYVNEARAKRLAEDFVNAINEGKTSVIVKVYQEKELIDKEIELILPPEISHFEEIEGVWIKNKHLEKVGLKKDSLAIVANAEIKRGDLVAVLELESDEVICGFYDADFGVICLERLDAEPQLFDEDEIQILGKIIGVANSNKQEDGKMKVEPITLTKQEI